MSPLYLIAARRKQSSSWALTVSTVSSFLVREMAALIVGKCGCLRGFGVVDLVEKVRGFGGFRVRV